MFQKVLTIFLIVALYKCMGRPVEKEAEDRVSVNLEPKTKQYLTPVKPKNVKILPKYDQQEDNDIEQNGDYWAYPKYSYKYGVDDQHTGDKKFHYEERDGDVVKGQYKLVDPDGYLRVVDYTVDKDNGYQAIVTRKLYQGSLFGSEQKAK